MSITDELREFASHCAGGMGGDSLRHMADCIDAEHERLMAEQFESLTVDMKPMTEENMAENGFIRLPKDVDGVPIRIGDVLKDDAEFKSEGAVKCLRLDRSGWFVGFGDGWTPTKIHEWRHYHKPTVEHELGEMHNRLLDVWQSNLSTEFRQNKIDEIIAEYAEKLRLADDGEER